MSNSLGVFNSSFLSGSHFQFAILEYPNLNFTVQSCNLPMIQTNPKEVATSTGFTHLAGDKLEYETLKISFIVDESLNNWMEIYAWLRALAPTHMLDKQTLNQYSNYPHPLYSSGTLFLLTNALSVNITLTYANLTGLQFTTQDTEDRKLFATVTFAYDFYDISVSDVYNSQHVPNNIIR